MNRLTVVAAACSLAAATPVLALAVDERSPGAEVVGPLAVDVVDVVDVGSGVAISSPAASQWSGSSASGSSASASSESGSRDGERSSDDAAVVDGRTPTGVGCDQEVTAAGLQAAFDRGVGEIVGADYQRAFELPDGRVLWVFQDAYVDDGNGGATFVHNAGLLQDGLCFESLHGGSNGSPGSWIGAADTRRFQRWYWPLDGYLATADTFVLFLAEMIEVGTGYLDHSTPVATWSVEIDLATMTAGSLQRSPNPDERLYGFEVTTDDEYVYLYAQCHRQFGFGSSGHDECAADVYVARQPLDRSRALPLEYWTGDEWSRNSRRAANIAPTIGPDGEARSINPMQVERDGDRWIAATLVGDWWGDETYFDVASRPEGPWTTTAVAPVGGDAGPDVASYFVSFVPTDEPGRTLAVSNNRWDGELSEHYRPTFVTIPAEVWGVP